jgi:hypothetical protein
VQYQVENDAEVPLPKGITDQNDIGQKPPAGDPKTPSPVQSTAAPGPSAPAPAPVQSTAVPAQNAPTATPSTAVKNK